MTTRPLSVGDGDGSVVLPGPGDAMGSTTAAIRSLTGNRSTASRTRWRLLARTDAAVALATISTAVLLWPQSGGLDGNLLVRRALGALAGWVVLEACLWLRGVYSRARRRLVVSTTSELGALIGAVVIAVLVALAMTECLSHPFGHVIPTAAVVVSLAACAVALPLARSLIMASYRDTDAVSPRVLVVGSGTMATDAAVRLVRNGHVELVGFVDDDPVGNQPVLGPIESLPLICRNTGVDRILVVTHQQGARIGAALGSLPATVSVHVLPPYVELTGWCATTEDLGGLTVVDVDRGSTAPLALGTKRALDVTVALAGLVLLAPILLIVAVAVRHSSPGPILFRQERIGRHGAPFQILKFRTMRVDDDGTGPTAHLPVDRHSRVTAVGHLLRRIGADEIPQLVNVLLGHMSLVGPRPLIPQETELLPASVERRFDVRPGMTGLWQICGQHDLRWDEMCRLDVAYVTSWTFPTDLRILALTPRRLWQGGGAIGTRWEAPTPDAAN